jgi:WD40 repeat protein
VDIVAFAPDGRVLASKSDDQTIRLWRCETWETAAIIPEPKVSTWMPSLMFHPTLPLLSASNSDPDTDVKQGSVHLWRLDFDAILGGQGGLSAATRAVHHTTGKIVLVGDHSVWANRRWAIA